MTVADIAAHHGCGVRMVNMTISLAFLSPTIVAAKVEGRLPRLKRQDAQRSCPGMVAANE